MALTRLRRAGDRLAEALASLVPFDPVLIAIPRRGVVVGLQVARHLRRPLGLVIAGKVYAPRHPSVAVGAVALGGIELRDERAASAAGVSGRELDEAVEATRARLMRRLPTLQGDHALPVLRDRTVVLVDDAAIDGFTMQAAVDAIAVHLPARIVAAVALCAEDAATRIEPRVSWLVTGERVPRVEAAARHAAIEQAICPPIADEQVHAMLLEARRFAIEVPDGAADERLELDGMITDEAR